MRTFASIVWAFVRKDFRILRSYRLSFLMGIFAAAYGIVSFRYVSHLVGGSRYIGNSDAYFRFVVVGVVVAGVLRASSVTTAANARRDQVEGTLEILATQPVSLLALGLGWAVLPVIEEIVAGLLTLAVAVPLGFHGLSTNWPATFLVLIISALMFMSIGFVSAAAVLATQQGTQIAGIAAAGMTFISGALFPIAVLPGWLQSIAQVSPLTYSLRAMRTAILDGSNTSKLATQTLTLLGLAAVVLPLSIVVLRLAFDFARRRGSLASF